MSLEKDVFKGDETVVSVLPAVDSDEATVGVSGLVQGDAKKTVRGLKPRHVQIMGMSAAVGTGLFIGSGASLAKAGPLGLVLAYAIFGVITWITVQSVGEMVVHLPVDGTLVHFADRFVDPSFAFAFGWFYSFNSCTGLASEITAVAGLINFWNDTISNGVWCAIVLIVLVAFQIFGIHFFGEGEFWFSLWKILLIFGLLLFTFITMVGGNPSHDAFGFRYWKDPGVMAEYMTTGALGRFAGFWAVFVQAAYAYGGPDIIALAAPETIAPRKVLPSVFSRVVYRLIVFYVLGTLAIGILVPYNDDRLGTALAGSGSSPFVLAAVNMKIKALPSIINAVIMTSAWSCGVEGMFGASRSLYALALAGSAPKVMKKTWKGVPIVCVGIVTAVGCLSFMSVSNSSATAFSWISNVTGSGGLLNGAIYNIMYVRFHHATKAQGFDRSKLGYTQKGQLYLAYIAIIFYVLVLLTNGFPVFVKGNWDATSFLFAYLSIPIFIIPYIGHMVFYRRAFKPRPLKEVDLVSGTEEFDAMDEAGVHYHYDKFPRFQKWLWG